LVPALPSSYTDIELWNASLKGDCEAFGQLFRRHYTLLYQYGSKICSDEYILEDSIQELFIELWQKKSTRQIISVKAYLLQALKFKLYKSFRNKKTTFAIEEINDGPFELSHETFIISDEEDQLKAKKILEAIDKLPPRQKEIIYLKIYKGLSYEEISEIMEINYQVVRNLLCQALKTFRKLIVPIILVWMTYLNNSF
jgi:RNA polymerase sigma factor (sigma-70 family)